ncbi:MAG: multiheme c-type cytochrome [Phycisphaerales bacterium]
MSHAARHAPRVIRVGAVALVATALFGAMLGLSLAPDPEPEAVPAYVVFANNDLGMHCMQRDFSHMLILPPYNTVQAVVLKRGPEPDIITEGAPDFELRYTIPSNTTSVGKTDWWTYQHDLLGIDMPADVGLTGNGLFGSLEPIPALRKWEVTGIPLTPINDAGLDDPYPLATLSLYREGALVAQTQTVLPVSWEVSCNLCHGDASTGVEDDILQDHDRLHATNLFNSQPVFCAGCHSDPALGAPGQPGISSFSSAMHTAHAPRLDQLPPDFGNSCYSCHPGRRAQCQRDVHYANGVQCMECHGTMADVGSPARTPWVDEPRCADCHSRPGFQFEQPGTLYRNSVGHKGVACFACHGSPHAITPTVTERDNLQAIRAQGHSGIIAECTACHTQTPGEPFFHKVED